MSKSKKELKRIYDESVVNYRRMHADACEALTRMRQAHEDLINWTRDKNENIRP